MHQIANMPLLDSRTIRRRLLFYLFATAFGMVQAIGMGQLSAADRPNVVFVLVDDMGLHDLGATGSEFYDTPNIDRIFSEGMRFTNGYAACRVCSPSRASIHLGTFPARHGITQFIGGRSGQAWKRGDPLLPADYVRELPAEETTLAEAFREAGYRTCFAGKWHLGGQGSLPTDHGYDLNYGGHSKGSPPGGFFAPFNNPYLEAKTPGESLTLRLGEETANFIRETKNQPFFAMLSFYAVHAPLQTTETLWRKYQQRWRDNHPFAPEKVSRFFVDETWPVRQVQDHPVYAGLVETTDSAVGKVLQALDETGLADNTIVCFTSDNGGVSSGDAYATSNLPLRGGKGRPYEGGIREPFAIRYPKRLSAGSTCDTVATGTDWYPTLLEMCGLPPRSDQHIDGMSLVAAMEGATPPQRPLFWHYPHYDNQGGSPSSIIRRGDWKLIHFYEDGRNELYRLSQDVSEQSDVSRAHPLRTEQMASELMQFLESVDAKLPQPDPRYDPSTYQQRNEKRQTAGLAELERTHARFLHDDFRPNSNWWGSNVAGAQR